MLFSNRGYCPICQATSTFNADGEWLRDSYVCVGCRSIPRQRSLVRVLETVRPVWRQMRIHESWPTITYFREQCARYTCSFAFEDTPPGQEKGGLRSERLEALTFPDASFDIFLTQDVLQHVARPDRALAEISRVLKPGGAHVFTVPKHKDLLQSRPRIALEEGAIRHLHEPVYHASPIDGGRLLLAWDFGADADWLFRDWSGYLTSSHVIRDRHLGIDGEFLDVFVTVKEEMNAAR
jgi:SAM-dependent methyltransferase